MSYHTVSTVLNELYDIMKNPSGLSIGHARLMVLPIDIKKNLLVAHHLETGNYDMDKRAKEFFGEMTDQEFEEYLAFRLPH